MSNLANITNLDSTNLLSRKSLFIEPPTIAYGGFTEVGEITNEKTMNPVGLSYKLFEVQDIADGLFSTFSFGSALEYTAIRGGLHYFTFCTIHGVWAAPSDYYVNLSLNVFVNGLLEYTFTNGLNNDVPYKNNRFVQSFNLNEGDVVNFEFAVQRDSVGNPNPNIEIYFTNFCLNYNKYGRYLFPHSYYLNETTTGFQSRTDESNEQTLLPLTDNLISFTGILEENGNLDLLDTNAKITPIGLNDIISVDFAFTAVVPVGSNLFLSVYLKVDGNIFRSTTLPIIKGVGLDDHFSASWILPVGATFLANGAEIYVNPIAGLNIKNRYICVTRLAKGQ
jgi:hypothetical protein